MVNILPLVLAGGLALQQTAATPIRVVVVTSHQEVSSNVRFGHPVVHDGTAVAELWRPEMMTTAEVAPVAGRPGHHCAGMRNKALALSNKFRQIFGFAPIQATPVPPATMANTNVTGSPAGAEPDNNSVRILPFIGTPIEGVNTPHHHHHHFRPHRLHGSFVQRVHRALMTLGPWEGRAVAFVLGCGLGVLLRMMWVMTILTIRLLRGGRDNEEDHDQLPDYYSEAEEIFVAPPEYTDEKVAIVEEEHKNAANTAAN
ncbi:hypothetical protein K474DRAFT_1772963 [Panus rudis PR-1116 ss-1]|nr:hypothetical protein K474DRAFT_1772963 [Panus rudis PR-1116 ss-1]